MKRIRAIFLGSLAILALASPRLARAQTASSGAIVGTITDPSGAAVPGASLTLHDIATNANRTATSTAQGSYAIPNVTPGSYVLTVEAQGFQKATISGLTVEVAKSYTVNVNLKVGNVSQTVEVTAAPTVELQTTNAQLGNELGATDLARLPTLQHNAGELLSIQPGVTQQTAGGGVRVTGALDDQNTITLDGIDISDNAMLSNDNGLRTMVPIPTDAVNEFRSSVAGEDASYGRSDGAQINLNTRGGTNDWHGAAYWYTQNSVLNANTWDNNRVGIKKPSLHDNRFGARLGGPVIKNKTFFFLNYEGRRFPQSLPFSVLVPTATLRKGILQFKDAAGNVNSYNLASSTQCGSGSQACDPRGLGISPTVSQLWSLMPPPNNRSLGDGLNTTGFTSNLPAPLTDNFYMARLDQKFTSKWQFSGMIIYDGNTSSDAALLSVLNANSPSSQSLNPVRANFISASLIGQITPTLINTFRFGYVRDRNGFIRTAPSQTAKELNLVGTSSPDGPIAISTTNGGSGNSPFSGSLIDMPINTFTGQARTQLNDNKDIQFMDDLVKVHGNHTFDFGEQLRYLPSFHQRADKVVGSLSSLDATLDADVTSFISIPAADRPPTCTASVTAGCILSSNVQQWDRFYAVALGMVDDVGILMARDGSLNPLPFGTPLFADTHQWAPYFYGMDTWRFRPSFTVNYGLSYGWQTAPTEKLGRQTIEINTATGQAIAAPAFLTTRIAAANQGNIFNPQFGYLPVNSAHAPIYSTDWSNVAPRVGLAWNPAFSGGLLGKIAGSRQTVLRGGFGIFYDRVNTVQSVVIPMLGVGFGQTISVNGPTCNMSGTPGTGCNAAPASPNPALSAFRVGQDGQIPVPAVPNVSIPVIPSVPFGEQLSFQDDPAFKTGRSYNGDFTIQRQLPGGMLLEVGWAGRWGRDLAESTNLNQAPYFMVDPASGQTFAQAFDTVATEVRSGLLVTPQPWFEDMAPKIVGTKTCPASAASSTACLATLSSSAFISGLVSSLFNTVDGIRAKQGLLSIVSQQTLIQELRTYGGISNYQGFLVSLRKQFSRGLSFAANYTLSKGLDDGVANEDSASYFGNSYFPTTAYGPTAFDQRHVFNANFYYDLPFGRGRMFHFDNALDKLVGGWYVSGILTATSGLPLTVTESSQVWGNGLVLAPATAAIPNATLATAVNSNVAGSNNTGTNGNPAKGGSGLNLFSDPAAAFNSFSPVLISQNGRDGRANPLRGLPFWNLDFSVGKETQIREQLKAQYAFYFFNFFNHPNFTTPSLSLTSPQSFGVITSTLIPANRDNSARWIEFTIRLEF
ncbi:MAG TPA: carboxypeptidase-like regulatory domain-containing protein [Candidatus Acidoferrales bacterium]|nr:carboxypeptidase-like regulatory domain-containing protein [Candidatus Acidoferrales bacterium]